VANISVFFFVPLVIVMPKILCAGCKQQFEDAHGYSNHKRWCNNHIEADIARRFQQLEDREHDLNQIQFDSSGRDIWEGQQGLVNTADGVDDNINMDMLVCLILDQLLILNLTHHLNMIRMEYLAPQPPSFAHLVDQIEKFVYQSAIGMNFHRSPPLSLIKSISMTLTIPVPMVILILEEGPLESVASICVPLAHHMFPNSYGIYCIYPVGKALYSSNEHYTLDSVFNTATLAMDSIGVSHPWWALSHSNKSIQEKYYAPFSSPAAFHLMTWFHNGSTSKSLLDLDNLIKNVILAPDFEKQDLVNFRALCELECLDKFKSYGTQS
jgi:hypothetical protein